MGQSDSKLICDESIIVENTKLKDLNSKYETEFLLYKNKVEKLCEQQNKKFRAENEILRNLTYTNRERRNHWRDLYNNHKEKSNNINLSPERNNVEF